jgi:hypothetical protein
MDERTRRPRTCRDLIGGLVGTRSEDVGRRLKAIQDSVGAVLGIEAAGALVDDIRRALAEASSAVTGQAAPAARGPRIAEGEIHGQDL